MAEKYTEAQAKASRKYQSKTVAIQIRVTEEQRDKYRQEAAELGLSLQQYIVYKLENQRDA